MKNFSILQKLTAKALKTFNHSDPALYNKNSPVSESLDGIAMIEPRNLSEEDYVKLAYIVLLQRKVDDVGLNYWKEKIQSKTFRYKELIDSLYSSPEFIMHYQVPFSDMLHKGRQQWCNSLEKFDCILDIGGSSPNIAMGALIELGYVHRPREITILDLPEERQYWGKPKFSQDRDYQFEWGTLKYVHGFVENIYNYEDLRDKSFDLIFMGQTIEHIQKDQLGIVLRWIREHLKKGGKFIFDTPNRDITKIQLPDNYIDEDHKYEYTPAEMEVLLNKSGFNVARKTGILQMPETLASNKFNPLEVYETKIVSDAAENSYVFAFECVPSE